MKFKAVVTEILRREVEIDASSIGDAYDKVDSMISDCEIVLDADDFADRDVRIIENI